MLYGAQFNGINERCEPSAGPHEKESFKNAVLLNEGWFLLRTKSVSR